MEMLNKHDILKQDSMQKLISGYPDHNFVIDMEESEKLFKNIKNLTELVNNENKSTIEHNEKEITILERIKQVRQENGSLIEMHTYE